MPRDRLPFSSQADSRGEPPAQVHGRLSDRIKDIVSSRARKCNTVFNQIAGHELDRFPMRWTEPRSPQALMRRGRQVLNSAWWRQNVVQKAHNLGKEVAVREVQMKTMSCTVYYEQTMCHAV